LPVWALCAADGRDAVRISPAARSVEEFLAGAGAAFFDDIVAASRLLRTQVESALGELVALGRVTSDSFAGLRALLVPSNERRPLGSGPRRRRRAAALGVEVAGRWVSLVRAARPAESPPPAAGPEAVETVARVLLRRYGIVFRKLLERETVVPPWRDLLRSLRRLEARGEIRGGDSSMVSVTIRASDAIGALRQARRAESRDEWAAVSAADPLNLVGIVTPGGRLAALTRNRVLYRGGVPLAVRESGETRLFGALDPATEWQARNALVRRPDSARSHVAPRRRTA
jgi:ATP-dependent Lhr-like helicase